MSAEGLQHRAWTPDLDPSYHRWEPPIFPGLPVGASEASGPDDGSKRMESAFARSSFPTSFAGWDRVRTEAKAQQDAVAAAARFAVPQSTPSGEEEQPARTLGNDPGSSIFSMHSLPAFSSLHSLGSSFRVQQPQGGASAFTALPRGGHPNTTGLHDPRSRSAGWAAPAGFGASFEGVLQQAEPANLRYGVPGEGPAQAARGSVKGANDEGSSLLVQCGNFTAPVQREAAASQQSQTWGGPQFGQAPKLSGRSSQLPEPQDALQAQEYYALQSDMLEELMRERSHLAMGGSSHHDGGAHAAEMESDYLDIMTPLHLPRSNSASELAALVGASGELEPYMPQWQSESMPAELPNHVVNRLMMGAHGPVLPSQRRGVRTGLKRGSEWGPAMPSIPDGEQEVGPAGGRAKSRPGGEMPLRPRSPNPDALEELARTADVEVAHRAFLVPPHKKRGKGGRQPAADPRLDPSIDSRRAKRILANRLSAARSKMKQKNQMDSLATIVQHLEVHKEQLKGDLRELLQSCEKASHDNRILAQQIKVLDEYGHRQTQVNARLHAEQSALINLGPMGGAAKPLEALPTHPAAAGGAAGPVAAKADPPAADGARGQPEKGGAQSVALEEGRTASISTSTSDALLVGLDAGALSAGDALLEFAQGAFMGQ